MSNGRKSERLLNLLIMLLVQRRYVPKSRIRELLYADSPDDGFERTFDRDKEELRSLGVPIEVGTLDPLFDDEPGYRISPERLALPPVDLTADEASVIGLATRVWQNARLADVTTDAVRKLSALGVDLDTEALDLVSPRLSADEPGFDVFWEAVQDRCAVRFDYRRAGRTEVTRRKLQPWGVGRYAGRWYVVGLDTDRGEERIFRLSRVQGAPKRFGRPGAYAVPEGTDVGESIRRLAPPPETVTAELLVRRDAGHQLRRGATVLATGVSGPDGTTGWDRLRLEHSGHGLADDVLGHGAAVVVEQPESLRTEVVTRLSRLLGETPHDTAPTSEGTR
ncbi:helix-turn-helix transcriptional regulator [Nocardioides bruguierae]|uniref:WYL domain-containing protein n=1 Tax=Nocardioides bruguierae TaxID=2945102 RepID=A0A9X2IE51_9ACTN|nr:WYL domain-containing protein [Nocardioides bruguierae]MCM0618984.1 WYL domain-containing protein [Nocardioides bruguierae]